MQKRNSLRSVDRKKKNYGLNGLKKSFNEQKTLVRSSLKPVAFCSRLILSGRCWIQIQLSAKKFFIRCLLFLMSHQHRVSNRMLKYISKQFFTDFGLKTAVNGDSRIQRNKNNEKVQLLSNAFSLISNFRKFKFIRGFLKFKKSKI